MPTFEKIPGSAAPPHPCPVCATVTANADYAYTDERQKAWFYRCPTCTFLFARPLLLGELAERQMNGVVAAEMYDNSLLKRLYADLYIKREINRIRRLTGKTHPRLLDVGCGTGWTSRIYLEQGFDVVGLEPSATRAQVAVNRHGIAVVNGYLESTRFDGTFDVVVMRHILEHFAEPGPAVAKLAGLLSEGGLLLVTLPNIDCLGRTLFDTHWSWSLPHHCNFFNRRSLRTLLEKHGFSLLSLVQSPSPFYFPNSFARKFPRPLVRQMIARHRVAAMLAFSPLALCGCLLGRGDNLNVIARMNR